MFKWTLIYKSYNFFKNLFYYIKDRFTIGKTLYSQDFKDIIYKYLNVKLKCDWIGRLYGIANPDLNKDGKFDINNTILEVDGNNTNNNDQVKQFQGFVFKQLSLIGKLFKFDLLYDYISFSLTHVGPTNADNYLLVFDLASRKDMSYYFKQMLLMILIYSIIIICAIIII